MTGTWIIKNPQAIDALAGALRKERLPVTAVIKEGLPRTPPQNALSHVWYDEIAKTLGDRTTVDVKRFCKLHLGVPILRGSDPIFNAFYDGAIKHNLTYEQKLEAMDFISVTSIMSKPAMREYMETMQIHWARQGIMLTGLEGKP